MCLENQLFGVLQRRQARRDLAEAGDKLCVRLHRMAGEQHGLQETLEESLLQLAEGAQFCHLLKFGPLVSETVIA